MSEIFLTKKIEYGQNGVLEFDKGAFLNQKLDRYAIQRETFQLTFHDGYAILSVKMLPMASRPIGPVTVENPGWEY